MQRMLAVAVLLLLPVLVWGQDIRIIPAPNTSTTVITRHNGRSYVASQRRVRHRSSSVRHRRSRRSTAPGISISSARRRSSGPGSAEVASLRAQVRQLAAQNAEILKSARHTDAVVSDRRIGNAALSRGVNTVVREGRATNANVTTQGNRIVAKQDAANVKLDDIKRDTAATRKEVMKTATYITGAVLSQTILFWGPIVLIVIVILILRAIAARRGP